MAWLITFINGTEETTPEWVDTIKVGTCGSILRTYRTLTMTHQGRALPASVLELVSSYPLVNIKRWTEIRDVEGNDDGKSSDV